MAIDIGNLLGAASSVMGGLSKESSLKKFISTMDTLGIQIQSNYEATFSAIPQSTFFIQSISTPSVKQNSTTVYFDGKEVEIPVNFEYTHEFSMNVINDASGFIYSTLVNFIMGDSTKTLVNSGYTITLKAIGDDNFKGMSIVFNGVRLKNIDSLQYDHKTGEIQTFNVNCTAIDYTVTPGAAGAVAGITGAIGKLIS